MQGFRRVARFTVRGSYPNDGESHGKAMEHEMALGLGKFLDIGGPRNSKGQVEIVGRFWGS